MKRLNQSGSHVVASLLGIVVVAVIAFAGYTVMQRQKTVSTSETASSSPTTAAPAAISNNADLLQASKALDNAAAQVDGSVNGNALTSDINSLL